MARQATMTQMHWTLNKSTKKNRRQRPSQKLRNGIMATGGFDPFDKSKRHLRRCTENPEGPDLMRPLPITGLALSADLSHARQPRSALGVQYCVAKPMPTPPPPHSASIAPPMYFAPAPTAVHPAPSPAPHPATHTHTISSSYVDEAAPLMALSARAPQMRPLPPAALPPSCSRVGSWVRSCARELGSDSGSGSGSGSSVTSKLGSCSSSGSG